MDSGLIRKQLQRRIAQLQTELGQATEALDGLMRAEDLARKVLGPVEVAAGTPQAEARRTLRSALLELIEEEEGRFTAPELYRKLQERWPQEFSVLHKASVSGKVGSIAADGLIREVAPAGGSRPAVYVRVTAGEGEESVTEAGEEEQKGGASWSN